MNREELLVQLNELYAEEVEAAVRYLHLAASVKGLDRLIVRPVLNQAMEETLEHAQILAEKVREMGGTPSLNVKLELPPEKISGQEAIRIALAFEQAGLDAYRELLDKIRDLNNTPLEEFLAAQVAVESRHVAELYLLLE